uniref:START domain-containing protein n=1 Tax=Arcella intermedia TaxID=1963864 RepID=A0A6B2L0C8_9EUKA
MRRGVAGRGMFKKAKKAVMELMMKGCVPGFVRTLEFVRILPLYSGQCGRFVHSEVYQKVKLLCTEPISEWSNLTKKKNIDIAIKTTTEAKILRHHAVAKVLMEETPLNLVELLNDVSPNRKNWDSSFFSGKVIEKLEENIIVLQMVHKASLKKPQESFVLSTWKEYEDGSVVLMHFNIEYSNSPSIELQHPEELSYYFQPSNSHSEFTCLFQNESKQPITSTNLKENLNKLHLTRIKKIHKILSKSKRTSKNNSITRKSKKIDSQGSSLRPPDQDKRRTSQEDKDGPSDSFSSNEFAIYSNSLTGGISSSTGQKTPPVLNSTPREDRSSDDSPPPPSVPVPVPLPSISISKETREGKEGRGKEGKEVSWINKNHLKPTRSEDAKYRRRSRSLPSVRTDPKPSGARKDPPLEKIPVQKKPSRKIVPEISSAKPTHSPADTLPKKKKKSFHSGSLSARRTDLDKLAKVRAARYEKSCPSPDLSSTTETAEALPQEELVDSELE